MTAKKKLVAETDQNWSKLTKVEKPKKTTPSKSKPTQKKETKKVKEQPVTSNLKYKYKKDPSLFPYETFPIRLEHLDGKDKKVCWFQCEEHFIKYVTRYNLNPKEYEVTTNNVALVGKVTRSKGK
jgi:hypothetical protein